MKKTILTAITISALLFSLFASLNLTGADIRDADGGIITEQPYIVSPTNTTYSFRFLSLNVSFHAPIYGNTNYSMIYSLDGSENNTLPLNLHYFGFFLQNESYIDGTVSLPELSETPHNITVYLKLETFGTVNDQAYNKVYHDSQTVFFNIIGTSPNPTQDKHFVVNQKLWAFDGYHLVCSFNATANQYLEFNIVSTNSDPERPNDVFLAEFKIESINHGTSYVSGNMFNQKVNLNYTDTYTIFVAKHPFYATITVTGTIDLKPNGNTINPTSSPSLTPTLSPELSPTPSPSPSSYPEQPFLMPTQSPNQTPSNNVILSLDPALVICSILAILAVAEFAFVYFKKHKR